MRLKDERGGDCLSTRKHWLDGGCRTEGGLRVDRTKEDILVVVENLPVMTPMSTCSGPSMTLVGSQMF